MSIIRASESMKIWIGRARDWPHILDKKSVDDFRKLHFLSLGRFGFCGYEDTRSWCFVKSNETSKWEFSLTADSGWANEFLFLLPLIAASSRLSLDFQLHTTIDMQYKLTVVLVTPLAIDTLKICSKKDTFNLAFASVLSKLRNTV